MTGTRALAIVALGLALSGCGGGGGGGGGTGTTAPPPPLIGELVVGEQFVPEGRSAIAFDDTSIYTASQFEITQIDKTTGVRRAVLGAVVDPSIGGGNEGNFSFPQGLTRDGDYLYFSNSDGRLQRAFLGVDGKSSLQTIVTQLGLGGLQVDSFSGNDTDAFWVANGTVFRKTYANDDPPRALATVSGTAVLNASATQLYVTTIDALSSPSVSRIDLGTGAVAPLQNLDVPTASSTKTATSPGYFYWVNGSTLYRVGHTSATPEVVTSGMRFSNLTAEDDFVYVVEGDVLPNLIRRIDVQAKAIATLTPVSNLASILVYQGNLYWTTDSGLFTLDSSNVAQSLSPNGGLLVGVGGKLVASGVGINADGTAVYDIAAGTSTTVRMVTHGSLYADSQSAYYGSTNFGIARIPLDLNLRTPENLPTPNGVNKFRVSAGWIYMSEFTGTDFSTEVRISRMQLDGTQYQILFDGEHLGLEVLDNNLYFLCQSACSLAEPNLVALAPTGGTPVPVSKVGDPQGMVLRNRIFYVDTSFDGISQEVFAINLDLNDTAHLAGLGDGATLDASSRWLYRIEGVDNVRYAITAWNRVGAKQIFDPGDFFANRGILEFSMQTDGENVYYWYRPEGIKRLSEDK